MYQIAATASSTTQKNYTCDTSAALYNETCFMGITRNSFLGRHVSTSLWGEGSIENVRGYEHQAQYNSCRRTCIYVQTHTSTVIIITIAPITIIILTSTNAARSDAIKFLHPPTWPRALPPRAALFRVCSHSLGSSLPQPADTAKYAFAAFPPYAFHCTLLSNDFPACPPRSVALNAC